MDDHLPAPILLNEDIRAAIDAAASAVPDGTGPDFHGYPVLYWNHSPAPVAIPVPPHVAYSELVTGEALCHGILGPFPASQYPAAFFVSSQHLHARSAHKSIEAIVDDLLSPGFGEAYEGVNTGGMATIDLTFVVKCMRPDAQVHMEYSREKGRAVLQARSELLLRGRELGMPELYMQWLGGANGEHTLRIPLNTLKTAALSRRTAAAGGQ